MTQTEFDSILKTQGYKALYDNDRGVFDVYQNGAWVEEVCPETVRHMSRDEMMVYLESGKEYTR